jgi:hypothetical protein
LEIRVVAGTKTSIKVTSKSDETPVRKEWKETKEEVM